MCQARATWWKLSSLAHMKDGSYFINAARGTCVEIDDLAAALESGKILGAAIDVFPKSQNLLMKSLNHHYVNSDNVILTPHIGGSTQEAQANIGLEVADKFVRYSDQGDTATAVNFPEVSVPFKEGTHRLLHIHKTSQAYCHRSTVCLLKRISIF